MKKRFLSCLLIMSVIMSFFVPANADDSIKIYVNENELVCEQAPFISDGRTMVPMRKIFESLNAEVNWDGETRTITANKDDLEIVMQIDSNILVKNGVSEELDVAPVIENDATFVPLRAVSQALGTSVEWLDSTRSVYVNSPLKYSSDTAAVPTVEETQVLMYAADGRTLYVAQSEVEAHKNVGWYTEPVVLMYAADGRTLYVVQSEVEAHKNVGWYTEPVVLMYAADGRTLYVMQSEVEVHKNVGWYTEPQKTSSSGGGSSYSGDYSDDYTVSSTVYITPSGKRYHYSLSCAGKNGYAVSLSEAQSRGKTPCKKCAS